MITEEKLKEAWDRIARTADGEFAYRGLQKVLLGVLASTDAGALQRDNGRRSLAAELMGLMAQGIEQSSGRHPGSVPVTFAVPGPRAVGGTRGASRRVNADTVVPGWSGPAEPEQT